ncbi:hypothetical protein [Salinicoccus roseus]|uniref:hypothetical protein n=1 Tax=Salinicoccus roseus TaxID=45670 RepID=UPI003DA0DA3B
MNKKRWTSLFIKYGKEEAADFLDAYRNKVPFQIISEPREGLTMIKVREHAENSLFYILSTSNIPINGPLLEALFKNSFHFLTVSTNIVLIQKNTNKVVLLYIFTLICILDIDKICLVNI